MVPLLAARRVLLLYPLRPVIQPVVMSIILIHFRNQIHFHGGFLGGYHQGGQGLAMAVCRLESGPVSMRQLAR